MAGAGDSFSLEAAWSLPIAYAISGTIPAPTLAIAGDWNNAIIGIRQDITYKLLDQATFVDSTGKVTLSLAQQDPAALADADGGTSYPFAVLNSAAAPGDDATASAKTSKR